MNYFGYGSNMLRQPYTARPCRATSASGSSSASSCLGVSGIDCQKYVGSIVPKPGFVGFSNTQLGLLGYLGGDAAVNNLFHLGRRLVRAEYYWDLRVSAFEEWGRAGA